MCADTRSDTPCDHTDEERSWSGTYTTVELHEAVEKYGYKVLQIYEAWHFYTFAKYDPNTQEEGLFDPYIDQRIPRGMYRSRCFQQGDLWERRHPVGQGQHQEEPRTQAKLFVNSLWGKFGQRLDYSRPVYMNEPAKYFARWRDEQNTIDDITIINEHMVEVTDTRKEEFQTPHPHFNAAVAAWVTTQARLELYEALTMVGRRVLYFNTDSLIYIHRLNKTNPVLGHSLGELTDELNGNTIKTFVSGGPKNYGLEIMKPRPDGIHITVCKVRGFTLNYRNQQYLNFDTMKRLIMGQRHGKEGEKIGLHYPHQIIHKGPQHWNNLVTRPTRKDYRAIYNKGYIVYNETTGVPVDTLPFEYRD
ncbi:uncharacterized protein [Haliotis cracherodii]|uniref:uncharacterized protein n=1 Tax=Haliotis cracherodii TaxID=6455 RepID=UPI0039ED6E3F